MVAVLLDANMLVAPFQHGVRLRDELDRLLDIPYHLATLNRTYNEARDLQDGAYRQQVERLVDTLDIRIVSIDADGSVDDVLISVADRFLICTADTAVREALRAEDRPHLYLRQETRLAGYNLSQVPRRYT